MKEIQLWNFIYDELKKNGSVILAAVVNHKKGSPGKQGFKMAVSLSGKNIGSIGGGVMEYNFLKKCRQSFGDKKILNKTETLYHSNRKSSERSGLICSGSQTNFIITLTVKNISEVRKIINALSRYISGKIIFNQDGIFFMPVKKVRSDIVYNYLSFNEWHYEQPTGAENIVYIIGGGHVGRALSRVLSVLNFRIIVFDDRKKLKTFTGNEFADEIVLKNFKTLGKIVEDNSFVVIVTSGFESDKEAVMQVIKKDLKYIGLMGTKAKIKKIFSEALRSGIKKDLLKKIKAPIGIEIGSNTPEEIAISIAAEIIKIKNS